MLVEKIDRLDSLLIPQSPTRDLETDILITGKIDTPQDRDAMTKAINTLAKTSTMPATLWEKFSKDEGYVPEVQEQMRDRLCKSMAERRINSYGAVCPEDALPKGWKAMVFFPTQQTPRVTEPDGAAIRRSVPWAGVRDNGLLVEGSYLPKKSVMHTREAFSELATAVDAADEKVVTRLSLSGHSLDNYKNASTWRQSSMDVTHNSVNKAGLGGLKVEMMQTGGKRFRDLEDEAPSSQEFTDRYNAVLWRTATAAASTFKGRETATFWTCQRALEGAMDKDALRLSRLAHKPESFHYNWLMGARDETLMKPVTLRSYAVQAQDEQTRKADTKTSLTRDEDLGTRRQQAFGLFPIMARNWFSNVRSIEPGPVLGAIDKGDELIPVIARHNAVTPRHVKAIRNLHWQRTGTQACMRDPAAFMKTLPLDHMPENKAEWANMRKTLQFAYDLKDLRNGIGDDYGYPPENIYLAGQESPHKTWGPDQARLAEAPSRHAPLGKALGNYTPGGVSDMFRHLQTHLVNPILKNAAYQDNIKAGMEPEEAITKADRDVERQKFGANADQLSDMAQHWSLRKLADAQTRWHHQLTAMNDHMQDPTLPTAHDQWTGVAGSLELPKGIVARELTSSRDLRIQGMKENHCVGGYTDQVIKNAPDTPNTLIFSLEKTGEDQTRILSTVELKVEHTEKERKVSVVQNYATGNSTPSEDARKAGASLSRKVKKLPNEAFEEHFDSVAKVRTKQGTVKLTHQGVEQTVPTRWIASGYDPRDAAGREKAFEAYKAILPKSLGKDQKAFEAYILKDMAQRTKAHKSRDDFDLGF